MKLERRSWRGWWCAVFSALLVAAGCGSVPATGLAPSSWEKPTRFATTAELRAAIVAHYDTSRTARMEITDPKHVKPPRVGVVQWRPDYAHDISAHQPATATSNEKDERILWIGADIYKLGGDIGPSGKPWKKEKSPVGKPPDFAPSEQEDFDSVIEGLQVRGQAVLGYKFNYDTLGQQTYFMNAKNQLVQVEDGIIGVEANYTYYDFGVSVDIVAPPPDQVEPS